MNQELIFTNAVAEAIDAIVEREQPAGVFTIVDVNTQSFVLPRLTAESKAVANSKVITVKAGDIHKNIQSLSYIWNQLTESGATRHSIVINVGGGVVTDMGAFAASTFKRGIRFINVPTTLLGAVDAAVGGKTGINFGGFKNQIGAFCDAMTVIVSTTFFNTLPLQELRSGYAEMLKHGLLSSSDVFNRLLAYNVADADSQHLLDLLEQSVKVKVDIVNQDPTEKGLRRALNLGHTVGHAFESLAMKRTEPIPHGYAVAWGIVVELVLSNMLISFPSQTLKRFADYVRENYGTFYITCDDYPALLELMRGDKKNVTADQINFSLLKQVGQIEIDQTATNEQIKTALDIYRDLMGI